MHVFHTMAILFQVLQSLLKFTVDRYIYKYVYFKVIITFCIYLNQLKTSFAQSYFNTAIFVDFSKLRVIKIYFYRFEVDEYKLVCADYEFYSIWKFYKICVSSIILNSSMCKCETFWDSLVYTSSVFESETMIVKYIFG